MTRLLIILKSFVRGIGGIGRMCVATILRSRLSFQWEPGVHFIGHLFKRVPMLKPRTFSEPCANVELQTINRRSQGYHFIEVVKFEYVESNK